MVTKLAWAGAAAVVLSGALLAVSAGRANATTSDVPRASDVQITSQVEQKIVRDVPDASYRIRVSTQDGVVTLSGLADSVFAKAKVIEDAHAVAGVTAVKDGDLRVVA